MVSFAKQRFLIGFTLFFQCVASLAQVIDNPVFDRTDVFKFHVKKIEITEDTTYVYCSFSADEHSWANISENTYLENVHNGDRYPIIKVTGIPFSPEKRHFTDAEEIQVVLYFPYISANKIDIIENEEEAFNIYGIDLTRSYYSSYTSEDINCFFESHTKCLAEKNWHSALEFAQKQLEATNYVEGVRSFASTCSMYNMIMALFNLKDYDKIIELGNKAIDILQTLPQDSIYLDVLARVYGNVGTAYRMLKQIDVANNYEELSLTTRRLGKGIGTLNYEEYLHHLAAGYYMEGNYPKALLYEREAAKIYETKYKENNHKYGGAYLQILNNLTEFYRAMNQMKEAVECGQNALKLLNDGACSHEIGLRYMIYNNLGGALVSYGKIDEGISMLEEVLKAANRDVFNYDKYIIGARLQLASAFLYYKQDTLRASDEYHAILQQIEDSILVGNTDNPNYTSVLWNLFLINISNPDSAMKYLNKAINVQKKWNGDNSMAYANLLFEKVKYLWKPTLLEKNGLDSLLYYTKQSTDIIKRHINNASYNMSKDERKIYWQRYKEYFTWFIPTISGMINTDISNSLAYDAALFYKGMLLSAERELKDVALLSGDKSLIQMYQEYVSNLSQLEESYMHQSSSFRIDSLKMLISDEEFLLSQKVTRFNKQYNGTNYSWNDVKKRLNNDDVAIEMVSYKALNDSITYYDAYVINNKSNAPQLIYLCEESELIKIANKDSVKYNELSNLIWGNEKLHDAIKDAKNIYFSATGLLNIIGIEDLPLGNDHHKYINERFNIYRLSSTRELCFSDSINKIRKACIYGGLDYNDTKEEIHKEKRAKYGLSREVVDSLVKRGGFDSLFGSMQEVNQIYNEMRHQSISCDLYSGSEGTEESFKSLSGNSVNVIHLSTHGMTISDRDFNSKNDNNYRFTISDETKNVDNEDKSLSRSFLVMSGGNSLILRDSISIGEDDGILTALEISHLDFNNLDLVVLSACQTALGEITDEGVLGLQRAFKKAGANTIIMSLDKVDDEATRILMVEFYRNLMNGKTKHQSLKDAQKHLREVEKGKYDDPKYWASFIMLDGLN